MSILSLLILMLLMDSLIDMLAEKANIAAFY